MDLESELLALLHPTRIGDELAPGIRLVDVSTELGLRLSFEQEGREIVVEVDPAEDGRKYAARSSDLTFGYRIGDRGAPVDSALGRALCALVAARVAQHEGPVLERLRASCEGNEARIREVRGARLLQRSGTPDERYWTLSPYIGCLIGCRFCYAPSRLDPIRRLVGLPDTTWGSWVDVRVDAPEVLARELRDLAPLPIKMCPIVSDPYQAVEGKHRITRRCLEVLAAAAPRDVLVLTRSAAIVEDAALLARLPRAWAGVSLPTVDDDVRRYFEPRGASVEERLGALEALRRAGVRTFAIIQPMFPGSVSALADALAARVESVRIDVLYGTYAADFSRYPHVVDPAWQLATAQALGEALTARGVTLWHGELPPRDPQNGDL